MIGYNSSGESDLALGRVHLLLQEIWLSTTGDNDTQFQVSMNRHQQPRYVLEPIPWFLTVTLPRRPGREGHTIGQT